jgi:23S rRNA pseudouridine1911/1915/1917 synthase
MVKKAQGGETFVIDGSKAGQRLDSVLAALVPEVSRNLWQRAIASGEVLLDGKAVRSSQKVLFGSHIHILTRPKIEEPKLVAAIEPEILYEDDDVFVVNKPAGMIAHPKPGKEEPSLAGVFEKRVVDDRPARALSRLDRDTSGNHFSAQPGRVVIRGSLSSSPG